MLKNMSVLTAKELQRFYFKLGKMLNCETEAKPQQQKRKELVILRLFPRNRTCTEVFVKLYLLVVYLIGILILKYERGVPTLV